MYDNNDDDDNGSDDDDNYDYIDNKHTNNNNNDNDDDDDKLRPYPDGVSLSCCRYRGMYQWEDGIVAHYVNYERYAKPPTCAGMERAGNLLIIPVSFKSSDYMSFLCEEEETRRHEHDMSQMSRTHMPNSDSASAHFPHVVCSLGHYTHKFLACDIQSACWLRDSPVDRGVNGTVVTLCKSILATLFACRDGLEHVPYSLVCDHSQDCMDSSDEDFCVHPSCSGSEQFECTNKQVKQK